LPESKSVYPIQLEFGGWKAEVYPLRKHEWEIHVRNGKADYRTYRFLGDLGRAEGFATGLMVAKKEKEKR